MDMTAPDPGPLRAGAGAPDWTVPAVSIIVAGPAAPDALRETLASTLAIAAPAHEVIVIDTGTDPATTEVLRDFIRLDPFLRPLRARGLNAAAARNAGAALARGRALVFVAPGARLRPEGLAARLTAVERGPDAALVVAGDEVAPLDDRSDRLPDPDAVTRPLTPTAVVADLDPGGRPLLVVSRAAWTAIGGFDDSLAEAAVEDWLLRAMALDPGAVLTMDRPRASRSGLGAAPPGLPSVRAWERLWARAVALDPALAPARRPARARHRRALAVAARGAGAPAGVALRLLAGAVRAWPGMLWREPRATVGALAGALRAPARRRAPPPSRPD
ncbi:glycosyltransferase family 2 protein [Roseospira goensis]|uniref:Glycosyltransferase 2-like domain-containing protein n=1 Tax=Roseospira goensis TaxID=391922 RepID=A0A7W6S1K9_9PROT|nr:glycosyltransferase family A protein [Roseospira goensis]MBB4287225.1 hypothetical protein [Roseospira goensis]